MSNFQYFKKNHQETSRNVSIRLKNWSNKFFFDFVQWKFKNVLIFKIKKSETHDADEKKNFKIFKNKFMKHRRENIKNDKNAFKYRKVLKMIEIAWKISKNYECLKSDEHDVNFLNSNIKKFKSRYSIIYIRVVWSNNEKI